MTHSKAFRKWLRMPQRAKRCAWCGQPLLRKLKMKPSLSVYTMSAMERAQWFACERCDMVPPHTIAG